MLWAGWLTAETLVVVCGLQLEFFTGTSRGAGTDANVSFELIGDRVSNGKPVTSGLQRVAAGKVCRGLGGGEHLLDADANCDRVHVAP